MSSLLEGDSLWSASERGVPCGVQNILDMNACFLIGTGGRRLAWLDAASTHLGSGTGVAVCDLIFDGPESTVEGGCAFFLSAFLVTERVSSWICKPVVSR